MHTKVDKLDQPHKEARLGFKLKKLPQANKQRKQKNRHGVQKRQIAQYERRKSTEKVKNLKKNPEGGDMDKET